MIRKEGALGFWLDWLEHNGGLWEDDGERALAVLPESLTQDFELAEETAVTADPDVAREEGALLLIPGHPLIARAAESLLNAGDTGTVTLAPPRSAPPGAELLLAKVREAFPVDHGRVDARLGSPPFRALRLVLRVGALVGYEFSVEDHFQEQVEVHVDLATRLPLPERTADRLARSEREPGPGQEFDRSSLEAALACAHQRIDELATARRLVLADQTGNSLDQETARAREYYAAALESLERRARAAPEERRALLEARAQSTREERARRLAEIQEKFRARHEITPYRLHLLEVPVLRLEVDVSRGARRYPLTFDWLLPVGEFAQLRCPACGIQGPALVATKTHLGCERCVVTKATPSAAASPSGAVPAARKPKAKPAPAKPAPAKPAPAEPQRANASKAAAPVPPQATRTAAARKSNAPDRGGKKHSVGSGNDRALAFWRHAARGELTHLRELCEPNSPAVTLLRLYGARGPAYAIGVGPKESVQPLSSRTYPGAVEYTGGEVSTGQGRHPYLLVWSVSGSGQLAEVLAYASPTRLNLATMIGRYNRQTTPRITTAPKPGLGGDPVAAALWKETLPRRGMGSTLRALTAWWRLPEQSALWECYPSRVLAAAAERAVCYWAGTDGGGYTAAALQWGVDEAELRKAGAHLQRQLKLSPDTLW